MTTIVPMSDAELTYLLRAPQVCLDQCNAEESQVCESLRSCQHYGLKRQALRVPTPWASSTDLHVSDTPDVMLPLVDPRAFRRTLYGRPSRLATWGDWLDTTLHGDRVLWGLAVLSVVVFVGLIITGR